MPDAKYDAVIIGGGHNGLCAAAYLARAGQKVGIFESRHEEAGAVHSSEATVPGFWHNLHAQYMEFIDYMPFYHDFDLPSFGARLIKPEAQVGIAFADGRPPIVIYTPEFEEKTRASIARYSKHDADVFTEIRRKVMAKDRYLAALLYTPRDGDGTTAELVKLWMDLGFKIEDMQKNPKELIDELFESTELRALLYRQCLEWGADPHNANGVAFVLCVIWLCGIHYMVVGGTHMLGHAMASACLAQGVDLRYNHRVRGILTQGGRATGIELQDGRQIEAKILVSNLDLRTTYIDLLGPDRITAGMQEQLDNWRFGPEHCLGTPSFALHEPPDYKSARHDTAINRCFYTVVGYNNAEESSEYILQAFSGRPPEIPAAGTWVNTLWDPSQAPPGKHAMNGWFFLPKASDLSEAEWDDVKATYNDRFLELWGRHATNMTRDNVIADALYTPLDIEREMGMPEGDFGHGRPKGMPGLGMGQGPVRRNATEIEGLYMCPGNGVSAAPGYGAFKEIAEDFGLPEIWKRDDRIY
ncbi:MAG: NAD(P)/FAD-dependent oxidoreductase [Dehalococcoidia bacterium]